MLKISFGFTIRRTHWLWLMSSVSLARTTCANEEHPCDTWFENDERRFAENERRISAGLCSAQHSVVGQDRPGTQHTTEESARFMSDPTRAVKCMLKRLRKHYSEAPVLSWSFPYQEMQCEARTVTEAYWEGELEGLSTTGAWICFGGYLLETFSSTQQIVALSTTESEYISTLF